MSIQPSGVPSQSHAGLPSDALPYPGGALSFDDGWAQFQAGLAGDHGVDDNEGDDDGARDENHFPPASQACVGLLHLGSQAVYRMVWDLIKGADLLSYTPDWKGKYLMELFSDSPVAIAERMQAYFDDIIAKARTELLRRRSLASSLRRGTTEGLGFGPPQPGPFSLAMDLSRQVTGAHSDSAVAAAGAGTVAAATSGGSRFNDVLDMPGHVRVGHAAASSAVGVGDGGFVEATSAVSGARTNASERAIPIRHQTSPSSSRLASLATPDGNEKQAALSPAACAALCGGKKGVSARFDYLGLVEWSGRGQLVSDYILSFDQVRVLSATPAQGANRYPTMRERWECRRCRKILHSVAGQTTNLTKHDKKCDSFKSA